MIPARLINGLVRYRDRHIATGGFLRAVLQNDLEDAVIRADPESLHALPELVFWINAELPHESRGSRERVGEWLATGPTT